MKPWWKDHPWRLIQTNLREIDMLDMDAEAYVRQLLAFDATVAMINAGGIIASYPTQLPDHFQSPCLKGDSLLSVIEACHREGIRVIARMDFSKIRRPVYERHPDWAYRKANGEIVDYEGNVHACVCGGYQQEYSFRILRETLEKLPFDGVFLNMGGFVTSDYSHVYHGLCHCENCKRLFRQQYGYEIPTKEDKADPAYRAYLCFKKDVVADYAQRLTDCIRSIRPDIAINEHDFCRMESNTEYGRPLPYWQYSAASNTRTIRGTDQRLIPTNTSVDFIGFPYRHVAVSAPQQKIRLYQALANLGQVDYYLIGRLDNHQDRTGYAAVKEVFQFHKNHVADYANLRPLADALILRTALWGAQPEERGWIRALTEAHILFDEALISRLPKDALNQYKTVILPNIESFSDEVAQALDDYVQQGGTLIATGSPGRYTHRMEPREISRLSCLGLERCLYERADMLSSMLIKKDTDDKNFPSMRDTDVLMLGEHYVYAQYSERVEKHLSLIPPHAFGPPEKCYYTQITEEPGLVRNACGRGQALYAPWMPGALYYREGYENTFFFLKDVLTLAGLTSTSDHLTEMMEVTAARNEKHMLVQFVNHTGHFGTSFVRPVPVPDVTVRVPCDVPVAKAISLIDERDIPFIQENNHIVIQVGTVKEFESVKLSFQK